MLALPLADLAAIAATPPNLPKALAAQRQLAAERPADAGVQNDLGNLLLLAHRTDEAEAAYRRALELDPKRTSALFNLALLEQDKGRLDDARQHLEQVIAIEPQHAWAHYQLGAVDEAQGKRSAAVDEYSRAFSLDPQLAFPDVNPHVVGSHLVTESLLRAYRQSAMPPQAPKAYEQPGRIASILVGTPAVQDQVAEQPAPGRAGGQTGGMVRATPRPGAAPDAAGRSATVIRPGNLPRGAATGQAQPPGTSNRTPGVGGYRVLGQAGTTGGVRNWPRPDPNLPNPNLDADEDDEPPPQPPIQPQITPPPGVAVVPPPGNLYYQPGRASSGRLEIELLPAASAVRAGG
jgi:Flp pilus assembly protein TadD